jgi:hypothetical protein
VIKFVHTPAAEIAVLASWGLEETASEAELVWA